ncbi:MAG: hypothetical protein EZS28_018995, partial [Streblomastix strix]
MLFELGQVTIDEQCIFYQCKSIYGDGGAVYAQIQEGASLTIKGGCQFIQCSSQLGGAILTYMNGNAQLTINECTFEECKSESRGGAIFVWFFEPLGSVSIGGACIFDRCISEGSGGAINAQIIQGYLTIDQACIFNECKSNQLIGGAIYAYINQGSQFSIESSCVFFKCISQIGGGAISAIIQNDSQLLINQACMFNQCASIQGEGGAILCDSIMNSQITIKGGCIFYKCKSYQEWNGGGGICCTAIQDSLIIISGCEFNQCESVESGGGIAAYVGDQYSTDIDTSQIIIKGGCKFIKCTTQKSGGGISSLIQSKCSLIINETCEFEQCSSSDAYSRGGALSISISQGGSLLIDDCKFNQCTSQLGGAIYGNIYNGSSVIIANACEFYKCISGRAAGAIEMYMERAEMIIKGACVFNQCECQNEYRGGAMEIMLFELGQLIIEEQCIFYQCKSIYGDGGGIYAQIQDGASLTIKGGCQFIQCSSQNSLEGGGAILTYMNGNAQLTINGCTFEECKSETNGGAIAVQFTQPVGSVLIDGACIFDRCTSENNGGAIEAFIRSDSILTINGQCIFTTCTAQQLGGGITADIVGENSQLIICDGVLFDNCSSYTGGGIFLFILAGAQLIFEGDCKFINCSANNGPGGGMFTWCYNESSSIRSLGELLFDNCSSFNSGGGTFISTSDKASIIINKMTCIDCKSYNGGGLNIQFNTNAHFTITGLASFTRCESSENGGGINFNIFGENTEIQLTGEMEFNNCIGGDYGGGMYMYSNNNSTIQITGHLSFDNCSCNDQGGGLFVSINNSSISFDNIIQFKDCKAQTGGGIYSNIVYSSLYIQNASFERCSSIQPGNGGGIALIQGISSIIQITNSSFIDCKTISNSSDQRYGWGGAIFIQTSIIAENLNETNFQLRDLVFTGCSAINSIGNNIHIQSIDTYATGEAIENGNLLSVNGTVDLYYNNSYLYDYMGIDESKVEDGTTIDNNIPLFSFHALKTCIQDNIPKGCTPLCTIDSNSTIELQDSCFCNQDSHPTNCRCPVDSSQLEGIPTEQCQCIDDDSRDKNLCKFQLKKVELIVNTSKANPLRFNFYGERFIQENIYAKIVELQNKTQEEIKYEKDNNKQYQDKYNTKKSNSIYIGNNGQNHNSNAIKQYRMFESLTSSKYLNPLYHNYPNIISNQEVLPRDEDGYIIWPPVNATKLPLIIDNVYIEQKQKASFQMNDATWLDSRKKWYGMLISADNKTFVGKDGNEDEAIRIDVFVEEGEQFVNFNKNQTSEPPADTDETDPGKSGRFQFPIWYILLVVVIVLIIVTLLIFWCVIFIFIYQNEQKHRREEMERIAHRSIEIQRLQFQQVLKKQQLREKQKLQQQLASRRQSTQSISKHRTLRRRTQKMDEKEAGLIILRALLWNRDYHAARPAFVLMRQQRNVVHELIETEKNYVSKLEAGIKYYLQPLQKLSKNKKIKVSQKQLKDIFINMEQILKFHKLFSYELQCVCYNWTVHSRVGQTFCKQAPFMKISVEYFQKKEQASKLLRELLKSDPKFNQIVEDISQQEEVNHEPLEQLLNRPVKRISEYNLLLQKMNESMFDWQPDSKHVHLASKMMEEIASFFNFCIHRLQWQKYFHRIRLVRPSRCFVSDIEVFQVDSNSYQRRFMILLSDVLLICKKKTFQQKYELMNVLNVQTLEYRLAGKMSDMEQLRKMRSEINQKIENQKELERKQQEEDEEQMKIINDTKLVLKMD